MLLAQSQFDEALAPPVIGEAPRIEIVDLHEIPSDWRDPWDRLAQHASEANVFAERWFVEASLHLAGPSPVHMLAVWVGATLIGLLPLVNASRYGRTPVSHVQNWLHYHAFLGTPLIAVGHERSFWTAALRAMDEARWARGFFHTVGLVENGPVHRGLAAAAAGLDRPCATVHRTERAFLESHFSPSEYYEHAVRKKKRKEIGRLTSRLKEVGELRFRTYWPIDDLDEWIDAFLVLEAKGWKGQAGSALSSVPQTDAFFRAAVKGAEAAGRLQFLRLDLDSHPIAMLVTFVAPPGAFTFKIAFDEEHARFSPGVLIQLEYLKVLERDDIGWTDSCAAENHPMINSLWRERRTIVRTTVPLTGARRRASYAACRSLEIGSALLRRLVANRNGADAPSDRKEESE
jgi:CelD/BcsL family acetyltransferase involved in cellulose biosynthesis